MIFKNYLGDSWLNYSILILGCLFFETELTEEVALIFLIPHAKRKYLLSPRLVHLILRRAGGAEGPADGT